MSDSVRPHRWQTTRLLHPWEFPGKSTGVGCHCFLPSHTLLMLKILQTRLQQYMNHELPDVQTGFRKGRGIRDQIANIRWIIEKAREFQKNIYFFFIEYTKAFVWITTNCGKFFKRWGFQTTWPASWEICISVGQKATVRTGHGTTDWFQIGKGVWQPNPVLLSGKSHGQRSLVGCSPWGC